MTLKEQLTSCKRLVYDPVGELSLQHSYSSVGIKSTPAPL